MALRGLLSSGYGGVSTYPGRRRAMVKRVIIAVPVYVRKQIVHNTHVVRDLELRGAGLTSGRSLRARDTSRSSFQSN